MLRFQGRSVATVPSSAFAAFRFLPEIIVLAVRWNPRFGLSHRDVEELLTERGIEVDPVTVYRWVQRHTPFLADADRLCRHAVGDRWFVDETYVKVAGRWRFVYRAVDQHGQPRGVHGAPTEVVTDRAWTPLTIVDELMPGTFHNTEQYANNRIEADHGRLKSRLRPHARPQTRPQRTRDHARHAFMQNLRRGHYELGIDARGRAPASDLSRYFFRS